jgi:hypothetical protein
MIKIFDHRKNNSSINETQINDSNNDESQTNEPSVNEAQINEPSVNETQINELPIIKTEKNKRNIGEKSEGSIFSHQKYDEAGTNHHGSKCREQSSDSIYIKFFEIENAIFIYLINNGSSNHISRNYKKYIDTEKSPWHPGGSEVIEQNTNDSDAAQRVDRGQILSFYSTAKL